MDKDTSEGKDAVLELLEECVDNVVEVFSFDCSYHVHLPARCSIQLQLRFNPPSHGFYRDKFTIAFYSEIVELPEVVVAVQGEVTKLPVLVEPQVIDLGVCCLDGGVYQAGFYVTNEDRIPVYLAIKVPASLHDHVSTNTKDLFLQGGERKRVSVRLAPR